MTCQPSSVIVAFAESPSLANTLRPVRCQWSRDVNLRVAEFLRRGGELTANLDAGMIRAVAFDCEDARSINRLSRRVGLPENV